MINVDNKEVVTTNTITSIDILTGEVSLNNSVNFPVKLLDQNGETLSIEFVRIEGEEYSNWSSDDQYVVDLILSRLNLTKAENI